MSPTVNERAQTFLQVLRRVLARARPTSGPTRSGRGLSVRDHRRAQPGLRVRGGARQPRGAGFYDALQNKDAASFWREVGVFS